MRLFNFLNKDHNGTVTIETIIVVPIIFFILYFMMNLFMLETINVNYNNLANEIANDLKVNSKAYIDTPNRWSNYYAYGDHAENQIRLYINNNSNNGILIKSINSHSNQLPMPLSRIESITVNFSKEFNKYDTIGYSNIGSIVTVNIKYKYYGFFRIDVPQNAHGYNVII